LALEKRRNFQSSCSYPRGARSPSQ
jgi:hypothetical protein